MNNVTREYTWGLNKGGGIGGLLSLKESGSDYYYLYDGKGNVMVVLDSSQNPVASYRYDVFGVPLKKTGTFDQPYRFSTKQYDKDTGVYTYEYRFYNPSIGKWMTRDPLGEAGGINLYGFVGNNAVNYYDPWGLKDFEMRMWVGGSVGYAIIGGGVYNATITDLETYETTSYTVKTIGLGVGIPSFRGSSRPIKFSVDDPCMTSASFEGYGYMGGMSAEVIGGIKVGGGIKIPQVPLIAGSMIGWERGGFDIGVSHNITHWSH